MRKMTIALLALLALPAAAQAQTAGDAAAGEKAFAKCKACHVADAETNRVGPHLKGLIGRNVASVENYKYSPAMLEFATTNPVWTEELFLQYIENPKAMIPKTKMVYPGSKQEEERANLLAFLKTKM